MVDQVKICAGLSEISDSYGGFIIDQRGTLHDGYALYPDTVETLEHLKSRGKQVVLLSNSGKRSDFDKKRLEKMGLSSQLYDHIVTSTEVAWAQLQNTNSDQGDLGHIGGKGFCIKKENDINVFETFEFVDFVDDVNDADFMIVTGSDVFNIEGTSYDDILKQASRRQIKMICTNPETKTTLNSQDYIGGGDIARRYEEYGGVVHYIGKPFPAIFQYALSLFDNLYPSQICVIGDSFGSDIRGASYGQIDCALVASGVQKGSFSKVQSVADIQKIIKMLGKNFGCEPTYFIPKFHWGRALPDRKNKKKKSKT